MTKEDPMTRLAHASADKLKLMSGMILGHVSEEMCHSV